MRPSPLLSAAAAASLLAALAVPASAADAPLPAAGLASSSATLLDVAAGGRTVSAGTLALLSDALGQDAVARILATPLVVDGKAYGQRTITPAQSPQTVSSVDSGAVAPALAGLVEVSSPTLTGEASNDASGPSTRVGADSFGGLSVLGLPIALDGTLDAGSVVSRTGGAVGDKTLEITDLALPSVADLLAALGLDLAKLPTDVLVELLSELALLTPVVTAADKALADATATIQDEIDKAQAEVDRLSGELAARTTELAGKQSELAAKEKELADATAALAPLKTAAADAETARVEAQQAVTGAEASLAAVDKAIADATGGLLGAVVPDSLLAQRTAAEQTLADARASLASATAVATEAAQDLAAAQSAVDVIAAAVTALQGAVATLQGVVDSLQRALDAAVALLRDILKDVQPLIDALLAAVTAVLDGTPLVSIDALRVETESKVVSAKEGGQTAEVVGGEVEGLRVLGTDVLDDVLGTTRIDLLDLTGSTLGQVDGLVSELTGTLSSVLSTVDAFPALKIPAPKVELLTKQTGTGVTDGFGTATSSVRALSVTLPAITLPQALALPSAADLPAFGSALPEVRTQAALLDAAGNLVSSPVAIALGTLSEQARFRPAAAGVPTTGTPSTGTPSTGTPDAGTPSTVVTPVGTSLPRTGASSALAALGVALMTAAFAVRRRREVVEG